MFSEDQGIEAVFVVDRAANPSPTPTLALVDLGDLYIEIWYLSWHLVLRIRKMFMRTSHDTQLPRMSIQLKRMCCEFSWNSHVFSGLLPCPTTCRWFEPRLAKAHQSAVVTSFFIFP